LPNNELLRVVIIIEKNLKTVVPRCRRNVEIFAYNSVGLDML